MEKNHQQLWEECRQFIKDNIPPAQYDAWFRDVASLSFDNMNLTLMVPSAFFVEQLEERYLKLMGAAIRGVYGKGVKLYYHFNQVKDEPRTAVNMRSSEPSSAIISAGMKTQPSNPFASQPIGDINPQLNPRYNFENYCCSLSNKVACGIGQTIADDPSIKTFNPLFIFGSTGVGKTHLIQAVGIRIKERNPQAKVLYVTARLFQSQYTTAEAKGTTNSFFHFYQNIDTLIVDDIQDLRDKPSTQNTFFHIFNHLHQSGKQLILTCDKAPAELEGMEDRLLSRFRWGLAAEIKVPDFETRKEIVLNKARKDGIDFSEDIIEYICKYVNNNVRELEGAMISLLAQSTFNKRDLTLDVVQDILGKMVRKQTEELTVGRIQQVVCEHFKIPEELLQTKTRKREVVQARQLAMYFSKNYTKYSLSYIGNQIGKKDHATVLYACKAVTDLIETDRNFKILVEEIQRKLYCMN